MSGQRRCDVCGDWFDIQGRKKYCTKECARKKQYEQLREHNQRRRKKREDGLIKCTGCQLSFIPRHSRHVYCTVECRLVQAIKKAQEERIRKEQKHVTDAGIGLHF